MGILFNFDRKSIDITKQINYLYQYELKINDYYNEMIYRNFHGKCMIINKSNYHTDTNYYAKIIATLFNKNIHPKNNTIETIQKMMQ